MIAAIAAAAGPQQRDHAPRRPAVDEGIIRSTADKLVELGLRDAGYVYLNIDGARSAL